MMVNDVNVAVVQSLAVCISLLAQKRQRETENDSTLTTVYSSQVPYRVPVQYRVPIVPVDYCTVSYYRTNNVQYPIVHNTGTIRVTGKTKYSTGTQPTCTIPIPYCIVLYRRRQYSATIQYCTVNTYYRYYSTGTIPMRQVFHIKAEPSRSHVIRNVIQLRCVPRKTQKVPPSRINELRNVLDLMDHM